MRSLTSLTLFFVLGGAALSAFADLKTMGADYRTMISNYHMVTEITKRCPDVAAPAMEPRMNVDKMLQNKLGMELYVQTMIRIQQSSLRKDAVTAVDELWERIDDCNDPRLLQVLERIAGIHAQSFARFEKEPAFAKPKPVPVPLRQ